MKKKLLCCALFGAMGLAQTASAQDFDDRWYLTAGAGFNFQDNDRLTEDAFTGNIGVGRFVNPNWSVDVELNYLNPDRRNTNLEFTQYGISLDARRFFWHEGRTWAPYFVGGIGAQRHEEDFGVNGERSGTNLAFKLGGGIQTELGRHFAARVELGFRSDFDDDSIVDPTSDRFTDAYATITAIFPLGARTEAAPAPAPAPVAAPAPEKTCADLDDDGDGVNNCDDKCPNSEAGQAVGPDGCPVPLTIDLKGVNFDFDKSTLRPDAVAILDEAVSILNKYPQLRVEVAGHTDSVGTEVYNQGLSERRARAVYDYLAGHGVDASRMVGPHGFGETKPIDDNHTKEGRARNRRTELNVQN